VARELEVDLRVARARERRGIVREQHCGALGVAARERAREVFASVAREVRVVVVDAARSKLAPARRSRRARCAARACRAAHRLDPRVGAE
jgi:hypothetical protein